MVMVMLMLMLMLMLDKTLLPLRSGAGEKLLTPA
jgi:hypothetical protein